MKIRSLIRVLIIVTAGTNGAAWAEADAQVILRSDIEFQPLNPARGDVGPQAGVVWGDIRQDTATGALIKFTDGFSSPPHIHNITYRAIVIDGAVHNDDPDAEKMGMGPGSFWTQPAGESHITAAAAGNSATVFLEIQEGPYLVRPVEEAFDNGEMPVNLDAGNVVWLDASDSNWIAQSAMSDPAERAKIAFLWGSPRQGQNNGTFLQLPAGFSGELRGDGPALRAMVIQGRTIHSLPGASDVSSLEPGSYFGSSGNMLHKISCEGDGACIIYLSTEGKYRVAAALTKQ